MENVMNDRADIPLTLVLGGTGKTGRRVVERLAARGVPVRIGSRTGRPAFDWDDRSGWAAALQGVSAVYIAYAPDLAMPGAVDVVDAFARQAVESGARRLVLLSGRGEEEAQLCEAAVQASGADWTILRASWFSQNFSENYLVDAVRGGLVALPAGPVGEPFIDADDIADAAVAALTEDGHIGQLYELTGPRLLSFADAIGEIAEAAGRDIRYRQTPLAEFEAELAAAGLPTDLANLLKYLFSEVLDGRNAHLTDGVRRALGRAPRDFSAYVRAAAATGIWAA
jgi:uncharacterized protein YbjT (DUF2867 family)